VMWLIAEDETDIRNLVETLCRAWGYETMTFESGQHVWDWLDKVEAGQYHGPMPEFALMDIRMPGKRGDEVAHRLRASRALGHIPIVLMTAYTLNQSQRDEMMTAGADQIINKPLPDFMQLHTLLHNVMVGR
jgi:CheY-like chemotaxis protein